MKKISLIFPLLIVLTNAYCQTPIYKALALNGLDSASFRTEQQYFELNKDKDNRPDIASVWFDKTTIGRIVALLDSEKKKDEKFCPDGIRIYYTADPNGVPFLKASVVMVSTHTDTPISRPNQSIHRDYYNHDSNDSLFKTGSDSLRGQVRNDDCDGGAMLYVHNGKDDCPHDPSDTNAVSISAAEGMVIRNKNHKHMINTVAEWLPLKVFRIYAKDQSSDGVRIYFARRRGFLGIFTTGRNSFLLINTKADSTNNKIHIDDLNCETSLVYFNRHMHFDKRQIHAKELWVSGPTDNGELCPTYCN